jgi:thiamine-monophosphate kinase
MPASLSEFALISKFFAPLATDTAALALTDDACLIEENALRDLVVTTDALIEGVHFLNRDPPSLISRKALRVNLSDLAAKGARPIGYLLALALPHDRDETWLEGFAAGLAEDQKRFAVSLLGGDTTATPGPVTLAVTVLGEVSKGAMIRRAGARPGDLVFVSGTVGDAGAGLEILKGELDGGANAEFLIDRYRLPTPRLELGAALHGVASAALDVSDGLVADLGHIAEVSKVRLTIEADRIPVSPALHALGRPDAVVRAATSGDDYEIAFTARSEADALDAGKRAGVAVTRIGRVESGEGIALVDSEGHRIPVEKGGYSHF